MELLGWLTARLVGQEGFWLTYLQMAPVHLPFKGDTKELK